VQASGFAHGEQPCGELRLASRKPAIEEVKGEEVKGEEVKGEEVKKEEAKMSTKQ
jgi:hypothetical protein